MPTSPVVPPPGSKRLKVMNAFTAANTALYRASGGRLGGKATRTAPILLLDHVGRKSGKARTSPLLYMRDGEDIVIVASRGGSDATPAWWLNLQAKPQTTVQIGRKRMAVVAREATAQEKERLWERAVEMYSDFAVYQTRTEREIPVILLSPSAAASA